MNARSKTPRATRAGRLATYLAEMFPPWLYIPFGFAMFGSVHFSLQRLSTSGPLHVTWRVWLGAFSVTLIMLLLRIYDELKDIEGDIALGRAGDPRYKDRAVVTGQVTKADITFLRWLITAAVIAINLPIGYPLPGAAFAVMFVVTWLSFQWFFCPAISNNLLLAFVTHNPLVLVVVAYVVAVFAHEFGTGQLDARALLVFGAVWFPVAAWETSRKIRVPADETDYQTYSKLLGPHVAALVPAMFALAASACLLALAEEINVSWIYRAILLGATALCVAASLRFRFAPSTRAAKLQPFFETYSVVASLGFVAALIAKYGIRFHGFD